MLGRMSSQELTEWAAFYALEPFGEERADLRAGIISATVANVNRGEKQEPLTAQEFMPKFGEEQVDGEPEPPEDDPEAWRGLLAKAEAMNAMFGGLDLRKTK